MAPTTTTFHDLLHYNATYRVLICRECQYAIQKSAVSSHLLRHKIYREERQHLLSSIAQLSLLDPDDVPIPPPGVLAIDGLPVIPGYRCTQTGCESLCASLKRMKRHQSDVHGVSDFAGVDAFSRPTKLQTFFRGTKLKYFEVSMDLQSPSSNSVVISARWGNVCGDEPTHTSVLVPATTNSTTQSPDTPCETANRPSIATKIDLKTMRYFYHYTTVTSHTLPTLQEEPSFWHKNVVQHALKHHWLMCGILAISTSHLATSAEDRSKRAEYSEHSARFHLNFTTGTVELSKAESHITCNVEIRLTETAHAIDCILQCVSWAPAERSSALDQQNYSSLHALITSLRGLAGHTLSDSNDQETVFSQAKRILDVDDRTSSIIHPDCLALLNRLRLLPSHLSAAFGRPNRVQDVLATLSAIAALVVCCEISFASDTLEARWRGMVGWLTMMTEHFNSMLKTSNPAALVVVAYWSVLVTRAENCGLWFLHNLDKRINHEVNGRLTSDESGLRSLLQDLL
jgi:hypothetical protein